MKIFAALGAYADQVPSGVTPRVRMLTVTAPGTESGLTWDDDHCAHLGEHRHSGLLGCRVRRGAAAAFNARAPGWWRLLHHEASQATLRAVGHRPTLLVRPWELQKRGVLHSHPVIGCSTLAEQLAADRYQEELTRLAPKHGFGFVSQERGVRDPRASAAYLSSYFVAGKKGKMTLRESVKSEEMPRSIVYVSPVLSKLSGITMRTLRLRRYAWREWRTWIEPQGLDLEVTVDDVWQGLQRGKTVAQIVTACLE